MAEIAAPPVDAVEDARDPDRVIVDPHLHLWDIAGSDAALQEPQTFLVRDAADLLKASGHRVTHTVFVQCHAMYRHDGPKSLRSLGKTEFALGMAAMAASGRYGPCRISHRIVASVDLGLGERVAPVLEAHLACAGERLRGVRMDTAYSQAGLFGWPADTATRNRMEDPAFVLGASVLAKMGLSLDVWCLHPQLPQVVALARAVPTLSIIIDHAGTPDVRGPYAARTDVAMAEWRQHLHALATLPNVRIKISGLSMDVAGPLRAGTGPASSTALAAQWRSRVDAVIDAFGPTRCMFASNYPADQSAGSYRAIWNAFKRLTADYSDFEQDHLFRATAAEAYHMTLID